jgi:hypothetical protein
MEALWKRQAAADARSLTGEVLDLRGKRTKAQQAMTAKGR